jgi:hypothetical protein
MNDYYVQFIIKFGCSDSSEILATLTAVKILLNKCQNTSLLGQEMWFSCLYLSFVITFVFVFKPLNYIYLNILNRHNQKICQWISNAIFPERYFFFNLLIKLVRNQVAKNSPVSSTVCLYVCT